MLLHLAREVAGRGGAPALEAVHVDHGLHEASGAHARAALAAAGALGVPCRSVPVRIDPGAPEGPEAAARTARYAALEPFVTSGAWLLTAHHRRDQAETLLLRLLRGAGPSGLAAMRPHRPFGAGLLVRPLLAVDQDALEEHARRHGLSWIEDPTNGDPGPDRNFLRLRVLPLLRERFPGADGTLARAAELAGETAAFEAAVTERLLRGLRDGAALRLGPLGRLDPATQRRVLRAWLAERAPAPPPSRARLEAVRTQLLGAGPDRQPLVRVGALVLRRFAGRLYALPDVRDVPPAPRPWRPTRSLRLPRGRLVARAGVGPRALALPEREPVEVRFRRGGERCRPAGRRGSAPLKKLFQELRVPPWLRDHVPLLYRGGELVAVAGCFVCAGHAAAPGHRGWWPDFELGPGSDGAGPDAPGVEGFDCGVPGPLLT